MGSVPSTNGNVTNSVHPDIILQPENLESAASLIGDLGSLGPRLADGDYKVRMEALSKARALVQALETPREAMIWQLWGHQSLIPCIVIGVETGLFKIMAQSDGPHKVENLAIKTGVEAALLARIMRHLAAMGHLIEVGQDLYKMTQFAMSLSLPIIGQGWPCLAKMCFPISCDYSEFVKKNGYKTPTNMLDGAFQHALKTDQNFFAWGMQNPPYGEYFNHHMGGYSYGRPRWMDDGFYPVRERLLEGFNPVGDEDAVMLVDVGGSHGHDMQAFLRKVPDVPGRLVVQDLPGVVEQINEGELDNRIERMGYDFHTEQPLKGARAYYMHSVLHDWSDEVGLRILANVTEAMKPGYSRLLINENVVPPRGAQWEVTSLDIIMSVLLSSKERTREDWEKLLSKAGLRIVKAYTYMNGFDNLMECELV